LLFPCDDSGVRFTDSLKHVGFHADTVPGGNEIIHPAASLDAHDFGLLFSHTACLDTAGGLPHTAMVRQNE
jgi:hypothetical protein